MTGRAYSANFLVAFVARTLTVSNVRLESLLLDASNFIRMRASGIQRGRRGGFTPTPFAPSSGFCEQAKGGVRCTTTEGQEMKESFDGRTKAKARKVSGFTLIEIVIVVAILAILSSIIFTSFSAFRNAKVLDTAIEDALTLISTARGETLSAKADTQYGVHLASSSMTLYTGATYVAGDPGNQVVTLDNALEIVSISLNGSGSDILFDRLTGKTADAGTFVIRVKSDTSRAHTVTVAGTGIASFN